MSYILQALKKSEQERELAAQDCDVINESSTTSPSFNRQLEGSIAGSSMNSQNEKSILEAYGLGVLCIFILLIVGYLYPKVTSPQAEPLIVEQGEVSEVVAPSITVEEIEVNKVNVQEAAVQVAPVKEAIVQEAIVQEAIVQEAIVQKTIVEEAPVQQEIIPKVIVSEQSAQLITPKIAVELAAKDTQSRIPNINISSHIYSSLPTRRSIVVNGERLAETDFITPNVQVKEITHQGMIIEVDGLSLVIDRSRGWSR
jgi:general secretion pathway protein B